MRRICGITSAIPHRFLAQFHAYPHAMPRLLLPLTLLAATTAALSQSPATPATPPTGPTPERHEFILHNFHTESGAILPEAHIVYGTYGTLNADRSNAILLPSHYMANLTGYGFLLKSPAYPAGALDTAKLFLVTSELFGNGRSSSPSNTPPPFDGPRFPVMTIRDNVNAVHQLLTEELHIQHLRAVIGFSMGAQQAFQWAVSYPTFMDKAVATSGTAKTYGHGIVRLEGQIAALTADPAFLNGDYKTEPTTGLEAFGMVWAGWLYSQEWWRKELWRTARHPEPPSTSTCSASASASAPTPTTTSCRRAPGSPTTSATPPLPTASPPASTATSKKPSPPSRCRSSTCPPPPTSTSRSKTRSTKPPSSRTARCCPSRRSGAIPPAPGPSPADKQFLNEKIAAFLGN